MSLPSRRVRFRLNMRTGAALTATDLSGIVVRSVGKFDEYQAERCDEKERDGSQDGRAQPLCVEPRDVGLETHRGDSDG